MSITTQREVLAGFKKEIYRNVGLLSVIYAPGCDISKLIFKEESYDKPTQLIFMHVSYYLATIIDQEKTKSFSWPLYDSQKEKQYRADISSFIATYASEGVISPVVSSFLVNPGCFKVVKLMFQLSQLAIQRALLSQINTDAQRSIFNDITRKSKTENVTDFVEYVEKESFVMASKFVHYQQKREVMEAIAIKIQKGFIAKEAKLKEINSKIKLNTWIDEYLNSSTLPEESKAEIALLKDLNKQNPIYDKWLQCIDKNIDNLESEWNKKVTPFIDSAKELKKHSETLISRHTGDCDKKSYILEYDPNSMPITTSDLEQEVNSQQKYVLKNIVKNGTLQFPYLIQGFVVSIGYILKGHRVENMDGFNECLDVMLEQYNEVRIAFRNLNDRVIANEKALQVPALVIREEIQNTDLLLNIPPLPDLTDLRANTGVIQQTTNTFTPLNISKYKFNLKKKNVATFNKPFTKTLDLVTPFQPRTKDNFLRNVISCQLNNTQQKNISQNISIISYASNPTNETIAGCSAGFTKQQLQRLLSTKKSSTKKKKFTPITGKGIRMQGLFDESQELFRSHSSPNLLEGMDRRISRKRRLPVMRDASLLEVSGIDILNTDSRENTPTGVVKEISTNSSLPKIFISPASNFDSTLLEKLNDFDLVSPIDNLEPQSADQQLKKLTESVNNKFNDFIKRTEDIKNSTMLTNKNSACYDEIFEISDVTVEKSKIETVLSDVNEIPKHKPVVSKIPILDTKTPTTSKPRISKQQSSLERIINRFKKVRSDVVTDKSKEVTITGPVFDDKENVNIKNVDNFAVPSSLPDLLSPSCNIVESNYGHFLDEFKGVGRQSLGTVLGVDESILDNVID